VDSFGKGSRGEFRKVTMMKETTYTLDALAELDNREKFPQSMRSVLWRVWCLDKNTWCILTDHAFTEAEAKETLAVLERGGR